jgi:hypothetical protein
MMHFHNPTTSHTFPPHSEERRAIGFKVMWSHDVLGVNLAELFP